MNKAVFLDRDGVINPPVFNTATLEYESPHHLEDYSVYPVVLKALKILNDSNYRLFIVTNQPSYAKGKTTLENLKAIKQLLSDYLSENGVVIDEHYYCYHHPDGVVAVYTQKCRCRKPGTMFLEEAVETYGLDTNECWFVGDRDTDVTCGKAMGMKTIQIKNKYVGDKAGKESPDMYADDLYEAAIKIVGRQ